MISRLGKEIDNPESVYYWAHKVRKDQQLRFIFITFSDTYTCTYVV